MRKRGRNYSRNVDESEISGNFMLFRETVAVYCENRTKRTKIYCVGRMQSFGILKRWYI
jgi:hypothetical protein